MAYGWKTNGLKDFPYKNERQRTDRFYQIIRVNT